MLLKPVTIPVEILALNNAKLSEKLLLAMYVADPKARLVLRALTMTSIGLEKLKQRLVDKRLLTRCDGRNVIAVPGLVYAERSDGGYFVSSSSATNTENKVASPVSRTTPPNLTPLLVSAELLYCKRLIASEKVLLAYYIANPVVQNERVVGALGISRAGLKKLKRGLLQKQVLVPGDAGYEIRLPGLVLVRDSEGGHFIPESEASVNGKKVALPAPKLTPANEIFREYNRYLEYSTGQGKKPSDHLECAAIMRKRVVDESPEGPEREAVLKLLKRAEDSFFAMQHVRDNIPQPKVKQCLDMIAEAAEFAPEKLETFREQVEGRRLAGIAPQKLLGMFLDAIELPPQPPS